MARMQSYPSRAQREQAARKATDILREAGHHERPERLVATLRTDPDRTHVVAVAVAEGTPLAERIGAALARGATIDAPALLKRTAELLRTHEPDRWLDHWGDGSVHGVNVGQVLKSAWAQLGGDLDVVPEDLPGALTLAQALRNVPPNTDETNVRYAFTDWTVNSTNNAETTLERVERALDAVTPEGRARRRRAGCFMAQREAKLREAADWLRGQTEAGEAEYDSTQLLDAARHLLMEVDRLLDTVKAVEPESRAEGAA